ncbi:MAG: AMP-binding protein [Desulfomonile tiedjei]|nr:AMP-binding protein [Desulfomonile tiedjei]
MGQRFNNLVDVQQASCARYGAREMFGEKGADGYRWVTFGEFGEMVDQMRAGLASLGVGHEDKVAVIANNCVRWAVSAYATYGLRAQFVAMYESQPLDEWKFILRDSEAKVLLVRSPQIAQRVKGFVQDVETLEALVCLDGEADGAYSYADLIRRGKRNPVPSMKPSPDEPFGLIYTSGTTGNPKGVILTHNNLITQMESVEDLLDLSPEDRSLSFLPWGHLMGQIVEVHLVVYKGFSAAIVPDPMKIIEDFSLIRPTIFFSVPKLLNRFHEVVLGAIHKKGGLAKLLFDKCMTARAQLREGRDIGLKDRVTVAVADRLVMSKIRDRFGGRLRWMTSGGAALSRELIEFMECLGLSVYEGYGLTETTMALTFNTKDERRIGSVGKPVKAARVVLDKSVEGARENEGEIVAYGPLITVGYHKLPELFAESLTEDGGFRTGDLGRFDDDGYLYVTGRIKELYKMTNGRYVAPSLLEEQLKQSRYVAHAMIFGDNRPYNIVFIVPEMEAMGDFAQDQGLDLGRKGWERSDPVQALFKKEIDTFCGDFKTYEKPMKAVVITDDWTQENGLLTPTLKLKRRKLVDMYSELIAEQYTGEPGGTP